MSMRFRFAVLMLLPTVSLLLSGLQASAMLQAPAGVSKLVGTVKAVNGTTISVLTDNGEAASVQTDSSTRILRVEPGQKDLKSATPLKLSDVVPGDRLVARGNPADGGKSLQACLILAMSRVDVAARQEHERQEWQQHGTGGLLTAVDPPSGTITIESTTFAGKKSTMIHVSKNTIIRRYAPDSVKFEDARPSTLDQIKKGDQLRARGTRSSDGNELAAAEIVAGAFRYIAGRVTSLDPAANSVTVMDATAKKPVTVKVSPDSQVRKLPPEIAQHIATQLTAERQPGNAASPANQPAGSPVTPSAPAGAGGFGRRAGGQGDFQQVLSRSPAIPLADVQKGDAVMIVSTEGTTSGAVTAITLLTGVEPILAASPKGGEGMVLSPWSLGGGGGEEASQ